MSNLKSVFISGLAVLSLSTLLSASGHTSVTKDLVIRVDIEVIVIDFRVLQFDEDDVPYFPFTVETSGIAKHLGIMTYSGDGRFYFMTGRAVGFNTMVAANGDEVYTTFVAENIDDGVQSGSTTIQGGSGRFEGAEGQLVWDVPEFEETELVFSDEGDLLEVVIVRSGTQRGSITY